MASPSGPLTPPAEPSTQSFPQTQTSSNNQQAGTQSSTNSVSRIEALLSQPATSLTDDGTSKRPRDHRIIHLLLQHMGISAYQERVPLQLMDFAYRYTSSVLSDALYMQNEGYDQADIHTSSKGGRGAKTAAAKAEEGDISIQALRMSAGSRMAHQFSGPGALPKEFLKQLADERNRISLNLQAKEGDKGSGLMIGGVRLPHEKYCLTGVGWGLKDEWDSEGEESEEEQNGDAGVAHGADAQMDGMEDEAGEDEDLGTMEDVFGDDGGGADKDGDEEMQD